MANNEDSDSIEAAIQKAVYEHEHHARGLFERGIDSLKDE